ncbi:hypothetical protein SOVF_044550 [Spinacia oleracea]|uniref:21 kDa seed protein-like n=1 Tax=Spinacia oleracea TaxID=3562 RepID=A0A9R0IAV6_SPIOL|nr:21 kDa seed protein-like [Spinacia oleracea]KNA21296.1 hypothetical protein SOVF_044550 [Spinacia oleracea]
MAHHLLLPAATLLLTLLFLSPPTATAKDSVVLDVDGNPVEAGSQYYVLTSGWGGAGRGGLTAASLGGPCPLYVGQYRLWVQKGSPVTFYPSNPSQKHITQSSDVNIAFAPNPICRNQGVWQLGYNGISFYITTNGVIGKQEDVDTFANWFKIEQAGGLPGAYKIVYCFAVPSTGPEPVVPDSRRRTGPEPDTEYCEQLDATVPVPPMGLSLLTPVPIDNPLPFFGFVFKKVNTTANHSY